jgi:hypothetical protein
MFAAFRIAVGVWVLGVAGLSTAVAQSPAAQPADPALQSVPPTTQPAEREPQEEAADPSESVFTGPLFYQAPPRPSRGGDVRTAHDPRTGRPVRGPVEDSRLTRQRPRRSAVADRSAVRASIPTRMLDGTADGAMSSRAYPPWWNRPTNAAETMQKTQFWARRIQPQRWPDRNQRPTTLDLWSRYTTQPAGRYQMQAYDTVTGRSAVGFRNPNNTVDYLNPATGRWYYGVPNRAGGQDWFDPVTGRWIFGVPANRGPTAR